MLEKLEQSKKWGSMVFIAVAFIFMIASGIFFSLVYFAMDLTHTSLQTTTCVIPDNVLVSTCQELFNFALYPVLSLRSILVWFSYFFIFGLIISMLVVGYKSGSSPVLMGVNVIFTFVFTYGAIEISNIYRMLLDNALFNSVMLPFVVYNKIMIYFPWFTFMICLAALGLGVVNFQKGEVNEDPNIDNY